MSDSDRSSPERRTTNGVSASGWYPDPDDAAGLRFWDGTTWSEHRARLSAPAASPAVCACGVAAIGRCRVCAEPYCGAHISASGIDDRPFRRRWEPWTCGNCIEDGRRAARRAQLTRCNDVAGRLAAVPALRSLRTPDGKRPRVVDLFAHPRRRTERPPRRARALLVEYDAGAPEPASMGLALTLDGSRVFDVGRPVTGVSRDRTGPKRSISGFIITNEVDLAGLEEAAARSTTDPWFEYAARSYLRAARHLGIHPDPPDASPSPDRGDAAVHSIEVDHDQTAAVQVQPAATVHDAPVTPPLPLPHP